MPLMLAFKVMIDIFLEEMCLESIKFLAHFLVPEIYFAQYLTFTLQVISFQKCQNLIQFERVDLKKII